MTIDKVRAALEHAKSCARNEYSMHVYKEALRELEGKVLVPVEQAKEIPDWFSEFIKTIPEKEISLSVTRKLYANDGKNISIAQTVRFVIEDLFWRAKKDAMIAPYVKGE